MVSILDVTRAETIDQCDGSCLRNYSSVVSIKPAVDNGRVIDLEKSSDDWNGSV